jgi:hypothetical protein
MVLWYMFVPTLNSRLRERDRVVERLNPTEQLKEPNRAAEKNRRRERAESELHVHGPRYRWHSLKSWHVFRTIHCSSLKSSPSKYSYLIWPFPQFIPLIIWLLSHQSSGVGYLQSREFASTPKQFESVHVAGGDYNETGTHS